MISFDNFTWLTIAMYLLAAGVGMTGMILRKKLWCKAGSYLALLAFFCQTFTLLMGYHGITPGGPSRGAYLQLLAWFCLLCGIAAWWRLKQDSLLLMVVPLALILFLMSISSLHAILSLPDQLSVPFYTLHIGSLFLSLGMLSLGFISGIFFIFLAKRIKNKKNMKGFWQDMPALSLLDKINAACAISSFPLYTIGVIAGLFWSIPVYGKMFNGDPKEISTLIIWLMLAVLFHNRLAKGWKGRKPAILAISIFILSCLSIIVVNFFLPTHHAFLRN